MKLSLLFLSSFFFFGNLWAASCCVSNTSVSNLMIFPSKWQETFSLSQGRVIGDVDVKGSSTFRRPSNKDVTTVGRMDLAYGWNFRYQTGISLKYQDRTRDLNGERSNASGWSDVGLSHAYRIHPLERIWVFQNLNIPTARSTYTSNSNLAVDARGTGTYQTGLGIFGLANRKEWDFLYSTEVHHSFGRTFVTNGNKTEVGSFWGTSLTVGTGYIPWKSKARYGINLTPRYEGGKDITIANQTTKGKDSLVWDTSVNWSYTINAEHAIGLNYTDQTIFGPARNTLLSRLVGFQWQTKWE